MTSDDSCGRAGREPVNNALNECMLETSPDKSPNNDRRSRYGRRHGTLSTVLREVGEIQTHSSSQRLFCSPGGGCGSAPSKDHTPSGQKQTRPGASARLGLSQRFNYSFVDLRPPQKEDEALERKTPPY